MIVVGIFILAAIGFVFAAWWTGRDREPTPSEIEQAESDCEEDNDWSNQDIGDYVDFLGNCEDWWG